MCRPWPLALLLGLLALAIRVGFVFEGERVASIRAPTPGLDADVYFNAARELRLGGPGDPNFELMTCSAPLHAYWLAGWQMLVGESMFAHRMVTALLASLRYVLLFFIALRVGGSRWAAAVGCLLLIGLPAVIHFDTSVLKAANDLTLLSLLLALLILPRPERRATRVLQGVGVGLALSACFLNQLNTLLYAFAVVAFVALRCGVPWRRRAEMLAPAVGLFLVTFALFEFHVNRAKEWSDEFLPHSGVNLLLGYQDNAAVTYMPLPSIPPLPFGHAFLARLYAEIESGKAMTPAEADQFYMDRAMDSIMEKPGKALMLTVERALASVNDFEIKGNDYVTWMKQRLWILWAAPGRFGLLFVFGCLGLVGLVQRREFALAGLFVTLILVIVASNALTFASYRFRVPMVIPLSLASAAGLRYLAELGRRYRTPQADAAASVADVSDSGAPIAILGWKAPSLIRDLVISVTVVSAASWLTFRPCVPELHERGLLASTVSERGALLGELKRSNLAAFEAGTDKSAADLGKHIAMLGALHRHSEAFRKAREVVSSRDDVLQANVHYIRYLIWLGRYDEARAFSARLDSSMRLRITRSLHPYEAGVYDLFVAPSTRGATAE